MTDLAYSPALYRRVAARAIDFALLTVLGIGLGQLIGFGYDWLGITAAVVLLYSAGCLALFGATLGKWLVGVRVVGPDGAKPAFGKALARESFVLLGAIPLAGPLLALGAWTWIFLTIRASPLGQGRHDSLAGGTLAVGVQQADRATHDPTGDAFARADRP